MQPITETTTTTATIATSTAGKVPQIRKDEDKKSPTNGGAFYPTLDGKPPKTIGGLGIFEKPEKHEKGHKKVQHQQHQQQQEQQQHQNDVIFDGDRPEDQDGPLPPNNGFVPFQFGHQHPHQQQHLGPYGFYNPVKPVYEDYNPYEPYDINPNGTPQGKPPPVPTSQSDLFNILGADQPNHPGHTGHPGHPGPPPIHAGQGQKDNHNLHPQVRIEQILQHLQQTVPGGPPHQQPQVPTQQQQQHPQQPQVPGHYVPIVHSGVPPPPPGHGIAIVDGQPVAYESYPVIPGLGVPPSTLHQPQQPHQTTPHQHLQQTILPSSSTTSGLSTQASEHSLHQNQDKLTKQQPQQQPG